MGEHSMERSSERASDRDFTVKGFVPFIKKHWGVLLLLAIILFGGYLRFYHIDYPVVGYHNWKSVHYLTEARNFAREGFFAHGFFAPANDYPYIDQDPSGLHPDTFPTISILVALAFMVFGPDV